MLNQKIKKGSLLLSLMFIMSSCAQPTSPPPNNTSSSGTNTVVSSPSNLQFNKVSEEKVAEYNSLITKSAQQNQVASTQTTSVAPNMAPMVGAVSADAIGGGAKMAAPYMSYFPAIGPFEEYTVIDFEEARTAGFSGTYLDTLNKIVKPVIVGLGNDARMTNSNGSSDANGVNKSEQNSTAPEISINPSYYQQYQWQFTYVSSSKKEVYSIFVSTKETLVLKQKWGIKDLSPDDIKIDSSKAIQIMTDSIKDKNFKSPDNQPVYTDQNSEILYEIPKNTSWYLYLEKEKGKLIWNINMNVNVYNYPVPMPLAETKDTSVSSGGGAVAVAPPMPEYWYSGGYARIDAASGEILSLSRPMRYKNNYIYPSPAYSPVPSSSLPTPPDGANMASPSPLPSTTVTPTPTVIK